MNFKQEDKTFIYEQTLIKPVTVLSYFDLNLKNLICNFQILLYFKSWRLCLVFIIYLVILNEQIEVILMMLAVVSAVLLLFLNF